jgi:hypothetical protein
MTWCPKFEEEKTSKNSASAGIVRGATKKKKVIGSPNLLQSSGQINRSQTPHRLALFAKHFMVLQTEKTSQQYLSLQHTLDTDMGLSHGIQ